MESPPAQQHQTDEGLHQVRLKLGDPVLCKMLYIHGHLSKLALANQVQ